MGLDNVIKLAAAIVMAAALTGQLPRLTNEVRSAQIKLLQESQASHWGSPDLLGTQKSAVRRTRKILLLKNSRCDKGEECAHEINSKRRKISNFGPIPGRRADIG